MFVNNIDQALEAVSLQIEGLKKKADDTIPTVQKLITHKNPWDLQSVATKQIFSRNRGWSNWDEFTTANEFQMKLLNAIQTYKDAMDAHKLQEHVNKDAIESNKKVVEKVTSIMRFIGIPGTYTTSEYKTSRSRKATTTTHQAGWLKDVRRSVPTSDNWEGVKREMESKMREIELYAKQKITELAAAEKEADRIAAEKAVINYATTLKIKHNLDYSLGSEEVLKVISDEDVEYEELKKLIDKVKELK